MYSLFSNVIVTNGALRSVIYDIQREIYRFIPRWLGEFLSKNKQFDLSALGEFGDLFIELEFIHYTEGDEIKLFPSIKMDYHIPCLIEVLVFDCSIYSSLKIDLLCIVDKLNIQKVLFYVRHKDCLQDLNNILNELRYSRLNQIEIIFFEHFEFDENAFNHEHRIRKFYFYNSPEKNIKSFVENNRLIIHLDWSFDERSLFHQHPNFFNVNQKLFTESQHFNTYYHKRLYIGMNGEISNGEISKSVGNISEITKIDTLITLVQSEEFSFLYRINKAIIDVCRDCEFRHMCVDNRIPKKRDDLNWFHEHECNYNPYICKWKGEEGYLTLFGCGIITNENIFAIDHAYISSINQKLWKINDKLNETFSSL